MKDFTQLADLAAGRLGGVVVDANDDFFAPKENLIRETKPIFIEGKFSDRGKWMDGWETRRRRTPGYDWCIIRLGLPGILRGVLVDTSFFRGNYPEYFSLEACDFGSNPCVKEAKLLKDEHRQWAEVLPQSPLKGDSQNLFPISHDGRFTHVRMKIYPDGGVARLRLYGEVVPDTKRMKRGEIDLVGVQNGGIVLASSDQFFGEPRNLLMPYKAKNMGDGWETKRRRGPGHDWAILKLGVPGEIHKIEVDTAYFKGNYPDSCSLEVCHSASAQPDAFLAAPHVWREVLPQTKLKPNHRQVFSKLKDMGVATHARFNIYPDGGVSRLRLIGRVVQDGERMQGLQGLNRLSKTEARKAFLDCCGSAMWAAQMLERMPFADVAYIFDTADKLWAALNQAEWLQAFHHHPAIGSKRGEKAQSATAKRWSKGEQAVAKSAGPQTLATLARANQEYRAKFGYVFLICATGKTSEEILASIQQRLLNDPAVELRIAAEEQRKITRIRLEKLLAS
jgi:allantoicase